MISSWRYTTSLSEGKESRGASWDRHKVTENKTNILTLLGLAQSLRYREEKGSKSLLLTVANVENRPRIILYTWLVYTLQLHQWYTAEILHLQQPRPNSHNSCSAPALSQFTLLPWTHDQPPLEVTPPQNYSLDFANFDILCNEIT